MELFTRGKVGDVLRMVPIKCVENDTCRDMSIKGNAFLLLIITQGMAQIRFGETEMNAVAPCFVAFSEEHNPVLIRKRKLVAKSIYFHPTFLNVNMTFTFLRDCKFNDLASVHDFFLMRPFLDHNTTIPILDDYMNRITGAFQEINKQLHEQPDGYWSCRARAGFMDIMMVLENHYRMMLTGEFTLEKNEFKKVSCPYVKNALVHIESHYMDKLTFSDILSASGTNHTTLSRNFKEEVGHTVMEYLQIYRIRIAEKQLRFTDIPLKDIARQCGFATTEHFSRIFTAENGKPPAAFRREVQTKRINEIKRT